MADSPTIDGAVDTPKSVLVSPASMHPSDHLLAVGFPLLAGAALYGWRGVVMVLLMLGSVVAAAWAWRHAGRRGGWVHYSHAMWLGTLAALMLPAHLLSSHVEIERASIASAWMIIPGTAVLIVALIWLSGPLGVWRVYPALLAYLVVVVLFGDLVAPRLVLHRQHIFTGDLLHCPSLPRERGPLEDVWLHLADKPRHQALRHDDTAAQRLSGYTRRDALPSSASRTGGGTFISLDGFLRDAMPPLEDLIVGGHPGPLGASSAFAVLVGGLLLVYRGTIKARVPLVCIAAAFASILILPVPAVIDDGGVRWRSLILPGIRLDWSTVITFANYELLASPLLFMAFFLAPVASPRGRWARTFFAILLGFVSAIAQLYISCSFGPYLALLVLGLANPWLEKRGFSHDAARDRLGLL